MTIQNLLVELFVEELPPKALQKLGQAFADVLSASLQAQGLSAADSVVTSYASPRRLAVHITHVAAKAADKAVQVKLMPVTVGLDADGNATLVNGEETYTFPVKMAGYVKLCDDENLFD